MTYSDLYSKATTLTARQLAQDLGLMYGRKEEASVRDIETVNYWQVKEGGEEITSASDRCDMYLNEAAKKLYGVPYCELDPIRADKAIASVCSNFTEAELQAGDYYRKAVKENAA